MNWTTVTDEEIVILNPKEPTVYAVVEDTMPELEIPQNATIKNGAWDTLKDSVSKTAAYIDEVGMGFADGVRATAKSSKYAPLLILGIFAVWALSKLNIGVFKT